MPPIFHEIPLRFHHLVASFVRASALATTFIDKNLMSYYVH